MAYVDIGGQQIYYEAYGTENHPTLVYMHGGPGESCLSRKIFIMITYRILQISANRSF